METVGPTGRPFLLFGVGVQVWEEARAASRRLRAGALTSETVGPTGRHRRETPATKLTEHDDPGADQHSGGEHRSELGFHGGSRCVPFVQLRSGAFVHAAAGTSPPHDCLDRPIQADLVGYMDAHAPSVVGFQTMMSSA